MVLHCAPVVAAVFGSIGATDCEEPGGTASHGASCEDGGSNATDRPMVSSSSLLMNNGKAPLVRFSEGNLVGERSEGIRSMYSERISQNQHRHMEVRLRSMASQALDDPSLSAAPYDSLSRFVGGDFYSGKVKSIKLPTGCWTMAFSTKADLLATGLRNRVEFLETVNFTVVYALPQKEKVSAIQWCPGWALAASQYGNRPEQEGEYVAVAGLGGHVGVYHVEASMVEFKGTQCVYEFQVQGEVRCMTFKPLGSRGGAILAVGDKNGNVTMVTIYSDSGNGKIFATTPATLDFPGDAILGLDCHVGELKSVLVAGTKNGRVAAFELQMTSAKVGATVVVFGKEIWTTQRNGSVRAVLLSEDGDFLSFGGYDKTVVRVNLDLLAVVRELHLQGTVNTIASDPLNRFLVVGCRDKSLTFFDTCTYYPIKRLQTPGWVTSISWGVPGIWSDVVAVRSENKEFSLLDLTPIHMTDIELPAQEGSGSSVSWTPDGDFLARVVGDSIVIVDSRCAFTQSAQIAMGESSLQSIAFSPRYEAPVSEGEEEHAKSYQLAGVGLDGKLYLMRFQAPDKLEILYSVMVEENLWALAWSADGKFVAVGGKGKTLSLFSTGKSLKLLKSAKLDGRVWDICFIPRDETQQAEEELESCAMAVASGDYKTVFFDKNLQPTLQVVRSRTVRCLDYHPELPLLAMGDGAGFLAIVDYRLEETVKEFEIGGRINALRFSPAGDFLLVASDDCCFTIHETKTFKVVQEFRRQTFSLSASFSPTGKYLALGSFNEPYAIMRMGSLLGIDLVPLDERLSKIPEWALKETLFRSGFGPSLVQRQMMRGNQESLVWVSNILKAHPDAIYTNNRHRNEMCLETALRLGKVKLLQVAVKTLVDGSLERCNDGKRSILTTQLPEIGQKTLEAMLTRHPAALIVDILQCMTFVKVPFARPHVAARDSKMVCASPNYLDPWTKHQVVEELTDDEQGELARIPAVLPIPGLGSMAFLSALVAKAPAKAFDNEAMGIVLKVMWHNHIKKYYIFDTCIFVCYYTLWVLLIELNTARATKGERDLTTITVSAFVVLFNSLFMAKELVQSNFGRRPGYIASTWNQIDLSSICLVYAYSAISATNGMDNQMVPLAVVTTLLLSVKLVSYLRAFDQTGWLVTVLSRNFWDVRGFLVVLLSIIVGFSASFRLLFATNDPVCELELDEETDELVSACLENPFGSLRRAILSTFELTILGSYEPSMMYDAPNAALATLVFVLAVTSVLVVTLNALISLLADSYARVQEDATANMRKEKAELIVEYMSLLPKWKRRRIERQTLYFHALLEADVDGDLVLDDNDWHGGLNALRDDIEETSKLLADAQLEAMQNLKSDVEKEIATFRGEMMTILQDLAEDVKDMKKRQSDNGSIISGKRVAGAVKEIRRKGSFIFRLPVKDEETK